MRAIVCAVLCYDVGKRGRGETRERFVRCVYLSLRTEGRSYNGFGGYNLCTAAAKEWHVVPNLARRSNVLARGRWSLINPIYPARKCRGNAET
jgi:hypothetical protein